MNKGWTTSGEDDSSVSGKLDQMTSEASCIFAIVIKYMLQQGKQSVGSQSIISIDDASMAVLITALTAVMTQHRDFALAFIWGIIKRYHI